MNHDAHAQAETGERASRELASPRLEELLRGVSHDLKSPLSAIMMTAASLGRIPIDERATPQVRRKAETIQRCAERMAKVIDDLLDVASLQCGLLTIETAMHDASALLAESLEKVRPAADDRSIVLRTVKAPSLPAIPCDRARIVQAMTGLLADVIARSEEGSEVLMGAQQTDGELVFFVEHAAASSPAAQAPAQGLERPRSRHGAVGLTIAKGIVSAHGGRSWSEHGNGSGRFAFAIPVAQDGRQH